MSVVIERREIAVPEFKHPRLAGIGEVSETARKFLMLTPKIILEEAARKSASATTK